MIRSNQRFFNVLNIVSDAVLVYLSFALAFWTRFSLLESEGNSITVRSTFGFAIFAALCQTCIYALCNLYSSQRKERLRNLLFRLTYCHILGGMLLLVAMFWTKEVDFSRLALIFFFAIESVVIFFKRVILLYSLYFLRKRGYNQKHILLVGNGFLAEKYLHEVALAPELGYNLLGYVAWDKKESSFYHLDYLGDYNDFEELLERLKPDEVVVALPSHDYHYIGEVIEICEKTGTKMAMIPFYMEYFPSNPRVDFLHEIPMLHLRPIPLEHFAWAFLKRTMDFFGALTLILLLSPLLLATAVGVKISSKGPVIFAQTRVGRNKKEFKMFKFRSMVMNSGANSTWSRNSDPRKTKFGKFIRKCSIDELPQLFNVLRGEMSLVGPRPEIPHFVAQFKLDIPHYMVKHQVRPGITGWAQVNGFRGDTSIKDRILHDIFYIEHWSLWFDVKILLLTLCKGVFNEEK